MALTEQSIEKMAGLAGVDTQQLKDAIASEQETDVELPEGRKAFNPDEFDQLVDNTIEEKKPDMKSAWQEEFSRKTAKELGLELSHEAAKDFKTVAETYKDKALKEAKLTDSEWKQKLDKTASEKDQLINEWQQKAQTLEQQNESLKLDTQISRSIESNLEDGKVVSKADRIDLFKARNEVGKDDMGRVVVKNKMTGQIYVDDKKNPLSLESVVKDFDKNYTSQSSPGRGGSEQPGGENQLSTDEIKKRLDSEGLKKGTREWYDRYYELKNNK